MERALQFALAHVAVPARHFEQSLAFYEMLGGRRGFIRCDAEGKPLLVQMMLGENFIELIRPEQGDDDAPAPGHLALRTADIAAAWQLLKQNGHEPETPPRRGESGVMWFFVTDPSGNRVEIVAPIGADGK